MSTRKSNVIVNVLPSLRQSMTQFLKKCWMFLAFAIIVAALISSLFRALTPWVKQYKHELEQHLSLMVGQSVTINTMETGWYWFEPVIKLNQVNISDGKKELVKLSKLLVGINLFSSLWHWQIRPGVLFIDDLHLSVHQENDQWQIEGIDDFSQSKINWDLKTSQPILAWILAQQKIIINNLSAQIYLQNGTLIPLHDLHLNVANHSGQYTIKGRGSLLQSPATSFQLLADLTIDPYLLEKTKGKVFFSVQHLLPKQWQSFAPPSRIEILGGKGNIQLWLDIASGQFQAIQTKLRFQHLAWFDKEAKKNQLIQTIKANLAWKPTKEGWQLSGDHIQLKLNDIRWPENSFVLSQKNKAKSYFVYVKHIIIDSLLSLALPLPESFTPVLAMKPYGYLHDSQIKIENDALSYLLTRFSELRWQAYDKWPAVQNLSGALHWQPSEGRLQLSGNKTMIAVNEKPPIKLTGLDTVFSWKTLVDGLAINMERFVVNHPNFKVAVNGTLDKITENSSGQLDLTGTFSAYQAQRLMTYLPSNHLKAKLNAWLKHEIKRIEKLDGELVVKGPLVDFPFDKQPGEFSVKSYLSGVDLVFARNWPLTKDIFAYLTIDKRQLEADISHANLQGIIIDKANLRVNDIGLDKETLLIHSQVDAEADKALSYIMSSPLSKRLSALSILKMQGLLALDLQLEAPLYPENDQVLALGDIHFKNNIIDVHHRIDNLRLEHLNGTLQFDQAGIIDSRLTTDILDTPASLVIQSIHDAIPYTEIKIAWETSVAALNKRFNVPLFTLMQGSFALKSVLKLTDDPNDLDHLQVESSLKGLEIDLPPPFNKSAAIAAPFTLDVNFNPDKATRLRFNYDNRLSSDILFSNEKGAVVLQKGEIRLSSGKAQEPPAKGLGVVGSLPSFDLDQWLKIKDKLSSPGGKNALMDALNSVNVKLEKTQLGQEKFDQLELNASKLMGDNWSINLNQAKLAARLRYHPESNTLSGHFDRLQIEHTVNGKQTAKSKTTLKPADLPNLDLTILSFKLGTLDLGDVSLKARASTNRWQLDYCKIKTPSYLFTAKGEWKQEDKINSTTLETDLHVSDLAASLKRLKISPAVEAQQGDLRFQGGWAGAMPDFLLSKLKGQMSITLKDGRITNLSPETEEKLGLGKLLSILSLQTIPRRLKLDFSDLSQKGYSFDIFQGNFDIGHGVMTTQDSYIEGPVAFASMKGNLDIARQWYDIDLKVSPHITASLPIVATIAGGPVAGFATWVASKIINQGMQRISGYTYKVSGPWQNPTVQQVSIIKKRLASKQQQG